MDDVILLFFHDDAWSFIPVGHIAVIEFSVNTKSLPASGKCAFFAAGAALVAFFYREKRMYLMGSPLDLYILS